MTGNYLIEGIRIENLAVRNIKNGDIDWELLFYLKQKK